MMAVVVCVCVCVCVFCGEEWGWMSRFLTALGKAEPSERVSEHMNESVLAALQIYLVYVSVCLSV